MSAEPTLPLTPSILVVDDDEVLRSTLGFEFELEGWRVRETSSGAEALEIIERDKSIDVVLTDVLMPEMGGVELLKRIRQNGASRPAVIFVTGYTALTLAEAMDRGAEGLLVKPFDRIALKTAVEKLLVEPLARWRTDLPAEIASAPRAKVQAGLPELLAAGGEVLFRLGRGGFFLSEKLAKGLSEEQLVDFSIAAEGLQLEGTGRVRWTRPALEDPGILAGSGIEILHLSGDSADHLLQYLEARKPRAFIPWR